jgi:hypothetical protein
MTTQQQQQQQALDRLYKYTVGVDGVSGNMSTTPQPNGLVNGQPQRAPNGAVNVAAPQQPTNDQMAEVIKLIRLLAIQHQQMQQMHLANKNNHPNNHGRSPLFSLSLRGGHGVLGGSDPALRNHLSITRIINPFYWINKISDHGRRQHCLNMGPMAYGSKCTARQNPAPRYDPAEVFSDVYSHAGFPRNLLSIPNFIVSHIIGEGAEPYIPPEVQSHAGVHSPQIALLQHPYNNNGNGQGGQQQQYSNGQGGLQDALMNFIG